MRVIYGSTKYELAASWVLKSETICDLEYVCPVVNDNVILISSNTVQFVGSVVYSVPV